jgi:putative endonuclease
VETKYLRMISRMAEKERRRPAALLPEWSVYVLRCGDGSLYTGIAKDVAARLKQHLNGKGAAYTRTHLPVTLVYIESGFTRSEALIREATVKRLPRPHKEKLVTAP